MISFLNSEILLSFKYNCKDAQFNRAVAFFLCLTLYGKLSFFLNASEMVISAYVTTLMYLCLYVNVLYLILQANVYIFFPPSPCRLFVRHWKPRSPG